MYNLFPELKVGHGDTGPINVALSSTPSHPVQPSHVNTSTTPQGRGEDHVAVAVGHVAHVASVIAHVEGAGVAALAHPGVSLLAGLEVGDGEGVVSVDGAARTGENI